MRDTQLQWSLRKICFNGLVSPSGCAVHQQAFREQSSTSSHMPLCKEYARRHHYWWYNEGRPRCQTQKNSSSSVWCTSNDQFWEKSVRCLISRFCWIHRNRRRHHTSLFELWNISENWRTKESERTAFLPLNCGLLFEICSEFCECFRTFTQIAETRCS